MTKKKKKKPIKFPWIVERGGKQLSKSGYCVLSQEGNHGSKTIIMDEKS
jgi:hypothetical protein